MRSTVRSVISWSLVFLLAITVWNLKGSMSPAHASSVPSEPVIVNMVQLLASPEKYDGKPILTHGFLSMQSEREYSLYLHEEDFRYGLGNGMVLRLTEAQHLQFEKLNFKYVLIEGTVYANGREHIDGLSGAIGKITRMQSWGPWNDVPASHQ